MSASSPNIVYLAINLPSSIERREHMMSEGQKHGINIQIVEAVSGETLTPEQKAMYNSRMRESMYINHLSPNEQACVHSHRKALQAILDSQADYGVILEDDSVLEQNFIQGINYLINSVSGWECCKLYTEPSKLYPVCPDIPNAPVQPVFPKKIPWGSVAYMYSRKAATEILSHYDNFWLGSDTHLAEIMLTHNIPVIGITPNLVTTLYANNEQSDIDNGGSRYRDKIRSKRSTLQYIRYRVSVGMRAFKKWKMRIRLRSILSVKANVTESK